MHIMVMIHDMYGQLDVRNHWAAGLNTQSICVLNAKCQKNEQTLTHTHAPFRFIIAHICHTSKLTQSHNFYFHRELQ